MAMMLGFHTLDALYICVLGKNSLERSSIVIFQYLYFAWIWSPSQCWTESCPSRWLCSSRPQDSTPGSSDEKFSWIALHCNKLSLSNNNKCKMKITGGKFILKKNLLARPEVGPRTEHRIVVRSASPLEHLLSFFLSFFRSSFFYSLKMTWQSIWSKLASWTYSGITLDIKVFSLWRTT